MQLTTRGWAVVGGTVGLYAAGRALGTVELMMLAAAGLVSLLVGGLIVFVGRPDVRAHRVLRPRRLYAGVTALAEIELENRGRRRTTVLSVTDRFTGRREARFAVPPLLPGETGRGAYRVPTARRGVFEVGPLRVGVTDPLGLVRRIVQSDSPERVTVYPRVEAVSSLPLTVGRDLVGGAVTDFSRSRSGMEFHSLREYAVGDDLRHVHWRSTARTGELMIREHDVPWQTRATLLLDTGAPGYTAASFERAVEATASVATALHERRSILRLVTTAGMDTGFGAGHDHYEAIMERLAVAATDDDAGLDLTAGRLHRQAATGALIAFMGRAGTDTLTKLGGLGRRFGFVAAVRAGVEPEPGGGRLPGLTVIDAPLRRPFSQAWNEAMIVRFGAGARR